ncbi:Dbl homology domain-containing protein [Paraphysoderma sedebokerense]|nr:Dbl homology domain-containing protein [Paraphysoderma sedebokerense]
MSSVAAEARSKIDVTAQQPQEGVKACVIKAYITQHAEDLSMEVDDIVIVLKTEGHRGFGSLNGKTGYFPLSHVRELNPGNSPGSDTSTSADEKQGWFRRTLGRRKNSSSSAESSSPRDSFYGGNSSYMSSPTITPRNRLSLHRSVSTGEPQRNPVVGSAVSEDVLNTDETLNFKNWVLSMGGPDEVQKLNLSKAEINRQEVIYEMAKTEQSYIKDLALVVEVYIKPLRKNNLIRPKDLTVIFSNWEQLLPLHQELFRLFEAKRMEKKIVGQVGEIWLKMSDYLKIYMMYCGNYAFALVNLEKLMAEKNFAKFCDVSVDSIFP